MVKSEYWVDALATEASATIESAEIVTAYVNFLNILSSPVSLSRVVAATRLFCCPRLGGLDEINYATANNSRHRGVL